MTEPTHEHLHAPPAGAAFFPENWVFERQALVRMVIRVIPSVGLFALIATAISSLLGALWANTAGLWVLNTNPVAAVLYFFVIRGSYFVFTLACARTSVSSDPYTVLIKWASGETTPGWGQNHPELTPSRKYLMPFLFMVTQLVTIFAFSLAGLAIAKRITTHIGLAGPANLNIFDGAGDYKDGNFAWLLAFGFFLVGFMYSIWGRLWHSEGYTHFVDPQGVTTRVALFTNTLLGQIVIEGMLFLIQMSVASTPPSGGTALRLESWNLSLATLIMVPSATMSAKVFRFLLAPLGAVVGAGVVTIFFMIVHAMFGPDSMTAGIFGKDIRDTKKKSKQERRAKSDTYGIVATTGMRKRGAADPLLSDA